MDRNDFKDQLAVNLIPLFTQMMSKVTPKEPQPLVLGVTQGPQHSHQATLPDAQVVAAHVYNYCELCALVRDEHNKLLKQAKGQGKLGKKRKESEMVLTRAAGGNNGGEAKSNE